jgi:hypothetical protein
MHHLALAAAKVFDPSGCVLRSAAFPFQATGWLRPVWMLAGGRLVR